MTEYQIGTICGVLVGLLLAFGILKFCNRNKKAKTEYDERQQRIRGKAYKYGFYTMMIYNLLMGMTAIGDIPLPLSTGIICFCGLMAGACVVIAYTIWNDAYWGINSNPIRYLIIFVLALLINAAIAVKAIVSGDMIVDGQLQGAFINLLCALLFVFVAVLLLIKKSVGFDENEEDE